MISKKIKYILITLGFIASFGLAFTPVAVGGSAFDDVCPAGSTDAICKDKDANIMVSVGTITKTLLFVLGAVAVLMIIIGGIMFVVSAGDAASVKKAKDIVLYSAIGLVVALLAYAIVNFVIDNVK